MLIHFVRAGNSGVLAMKRDTGIRIARRIILRPLAQLATTILPAPQAQRDKPRADPPATHGHHLARLIPSPGDWIKMVSGAFLISTCFLAAFIAANAWVSRLPTSLQSICSNILELYKNRDEITVNQKWRQEFSRLRDDCTLATHKYELTGTRD
jgi:hypothetical protein